MGARACLGASVALQTAARAMAARTRLGAAVAFEMAAQARLGAARALEMGA